MRILLVNKFAHFEGGSARYILDLYDLLKAHGHEVAFFAMHPAKEEETLVRKDLFGEWGRYWISPVQTRKASYGLEGLRTAARSLWSFEARRRIRLLIKEFQPDVVHLNSIQRQISPSIVLEIHKRGIPMIMTVHGYELVYPHYFLMVDQLARCRARSYFQTVVNREMRGSLLLSALTWLEFTFHRLLGVYKHIDSFICPSRFMKSLMEHAGFRKSFHLPNFYPLDAGLTDGKGPLGADFIYVARLSQEKGILELIEAYRRCVKKFPEIPKLIFYSRSGPLLDVVDRFTRDPALRGKCERRPFFGFDSFSEVFGSARVVMVPSFPYLENFPYAVTEAFSYGRPVLSSGLGGLAEMVVDGKNGWSVLEQTEHVSREEYVKRLTCALERVIQTPEEELRRMGRHGYEYVSSLTSEWYYGELMRIYHEVINSKISNS